MPWEAAVSGVGRRGRGSTLTFSRLDPQGAGEGSERGLLLRVRGVE